MKYRATYMKRGILIAGGLVVMVPLVWYLLTRYEAEKPSISVLLTSAFVNHSTDIIVSFSDADSGIRKIWIGVVKDAKELTLVEELFASAGVGRGGTVHDKQVRFTIDVAKMNLADGEAVLRMAVWDYSWRGWFRGNQTYAEKNIIIDTQAPELEVRSGAHNVSQGGTGLAIYRLSEPCPVSGVNVATHFFAGQATGGSDPNLYAAFFALPFDLGTGTEVYISAIDRAGNATSAGLNHYLRSKTFKKDTIVISDNFLNRKLPELSPYLSDAAEASPVDKFLIINRKQRQIDDERIQAICKTSDPIIHWEGAFLRLPKSKTEAGYADHRTYTYNGRVIDKQVHLGIDLASLQHAAVPAANHGLVVFADILGIYGKTVFIDHGFGLFSMYAHLNRISVRTGQKLSKGHILGQTGSTGLAGGDHLHFGILVHDTFVNPIEWWDAAWIKNNITSKLEMLTAGVARE